MQLMEFPSCDLRVHFIFFPRFEGLGMSSEEFSDQLLEKEKVAVVSGHAFGAEGYVRILATPLQTKLLKRELRGSTVFAQPQ